MITTKTGAKKIEGTDNWREIFDAHNDSVDAHDKTQNDLDITIYGNKAYWNGSAIAVTEGQFVSVRGSTISGITDGLYKAKDTVASGVSFVSANLEAVTAGGLNALNDKIANIDATLMTTPTDCHRIIIVNGSSMEDFIESLRQQFITEFPLATTPYARAITIAATWEGHDYYIGTFIKSAIYYVGILMTAGQMFHVFMGESASSYRTITMT